ncbi:MAG: CocE/NonD family hydrolase [Pseudomonadota bacterium]
MIFDRDLGIPLPDGTRLSAALWLPDDAHENPVPAILEYLPYRKTDGTLERDHGMHPHFARNGYAAIRVDRRGCGDSEGLFDDEYSEEELKDGEDIIAWIAAQPWCTGAVGMQGISWGGFNGLQIAARRPDALKAVISIGTTVDRFHDDIHYKGGIQLSENVGWAATVLSWFSMPPDPKVRPDWTEMWLDRMENTPFVADRWTRAADRDAYWKHGSICEDYSAIQAPVLVMGGLHDGYRNAMAAMAEHAQGPVKAIMGPWSHKYPNITTIGPGLDYLDLALKWWGKWLKGEDTDVEDLPDYTAYVMDSCPPDPALKFRAGRWVGVPDWRNRDGSALALKLGHDGTLGNTAQLDSTLSSTLSCGEDCGEFFPFGFGPGELPADQTEDNARGLSFYSEALEESQIILGAPKLKLRLSCDRPKGQIIARLSDVRPDGTAMLISLGLLNLRHREGFEAKVDCIPGETFEAEITLDQSAYHLPAGHKLCLSLSTSYWPYCWPEGEAFSLSLSQGEIEIPLCPSTAIEMDFAPPPPVETRDIKMHSETNESKGWDTLEDGTRVLTITGDRGRREDVASGVITDVWMQEIWSIHPDRPDSAKVEITWIRGFRRGNWRAHSKAYIAMQGTRDSFEISQRLEAWNGDEPAFDKSWAASVPR